MKCCPFRNADAYCTSKNFVWSHLCGYENFGDKTLQVLFWSYIHYNSQVSCIASEKKLVLGREQSSLYGINELEILMEGIFTLCFVKLNKNPPLLGKRSVQKFI